MVSTWYPDGAYNRLIFNCPTLEKDLNNYENKLFAPRSTTF